MKEGLGDLETGRLGEWLKMSAEKMRRRDRSLSKVVPELAEGSKGGRKKQILNKEQQIEIKRHNEGNQQFRIRKRGIGGRKGRIGLYSTECPPCEAVAPKFEALAGMYGHEIRFLKMYRQQNRELADRLGVKSSPTLLFYDQGKEVTERLAGGIKRSEIIKNLNTMLPEDQVR